MQLEVKTLLNAVQPFPGFVYQDIRLLRRRSGRPREVRITVAAHEGRPARCSQCHRPAPGYDRLPPRRWLFIPLWGIVTWFIYAARRVNCPEHGVVVEHLPWSEGKRPVTRAMMVFFGPVGAAAVVAGNGPVLPDQLGMRLSFGGMVCPVGAGPAEAGGHHGHRGG